MTPTAQRPLDSYETELLDELRREVSRRGGPIPETAPVTALGRRRPVRGWLLAGVGVAAAATLAVGSASLLTPRPAYALAPVDDGSVRVTISRAEDAAGLQRALADRGFSAQVTYLPFGQLCGYDVGVGGNGWWLGPGPVRPAGSADGRTFTITTSMGTNGHTALITLSGPADSGDLRIQTVTGQVAACHPVSALPPAVGTGPAPSAPPSTGSSAGSR